MKLLLDTHLILWSSQSADLVPRIAYELMSDPSHELFFSSVTIWEIAIKQALGRKGFNADAKFVLRWLVELGYKEVPLTSAHSLRVLALPPNHADPFDRILLAQAMSEGLTLLTSDAALAKYSGPILVA